MKIVEVNRNDIYLCVNRGFLVLKHRDEELSREPLDSIDALLVAGFGISYSHNLLGRLCELNIPLIICGNNFMPAGYLISYTANYEHAGRFYLQLESTIPHRKRLWQSLIKEKIKNQGLVLNLVNDKAKDFIKLAQKVKSGDSENMEAQAASRYWRRLLGSEFRRNFDEPGINSFLNYGYAILRSTVARYLVATGLVPALGLHHHNKLNPFCLADDVMEPFRPFVDRKIIQLGISNEMELTTPFKRELSNLLNERFLMNNERVTLEMCIKQTVQSLFRSFQEKSNCLVFPAFYDKRT